MSLLFLIFIIFIVPFALALYLWRDTSPKRAVYFMTLSVSALALIMLVTGSEAIAAVMPLGLFMASTSFFAGIYLSGLLRAWRQGRAGDPETLPDAEDD
ncbi:MAG: hypothetical protein KDF58_00290 [Alphaproteobacteria bacterium]|nr:hypothetical protein [Alphaproteobacteria bacterium]HPF46455.1 hypothetical protein [Emcibacteraceae bacterium]HRW29040.1 hypothetical protein [Emcibacteraceae bacterium]